MKTATTCAEEFQPCTRQHSRKRHGFLKAGFGLFAAFALNLGAATAASAAWTEMTIPSQLQPSVLQMRICKRWFDGGGYGKFWQLHLQTTRKNTDAYRVDVNVFLRDGRFARRYTTNAWMPPPANVSLVVALASIDVRETITVGVHYVDRRDQDRIAFATVPTAAQGNLAICAF